MANAIYPSAKLSLANGTLNWTATPFNIALLNTATVSYTATHTHFDDVLAGEITGTGYTHTGTALTSQAVTESPTGTAKLTAGSITWPGSTVTAGAAVIYLLRGGDHNADDLVEWIDFGGNQSSIADSFTVTPSASGLITAT